MNCVQVPWLHIQSKALGFQHNTNLVHEHNWVDVKENSLINFWIKVCVSFWRWAMWSSSAKWRHMVDNTPWPLHIYICITLNHTFKSRSWIFWTHINQHNSESLCDHLTRKNFSTLTSCNSCISPLIIFLLICNHYTKYNH